jgi:hypothetical protein
VPFTAAHRANILEDEGEPLAIDAGEVILPFRPHEILTVLLS